MFTKFRLRRPSHPTVVAYLALFVALGGTAAYATHETIFSSDIVDGEVKTPDLGTSAVTNAKIANAAVGATKLANGSVTNFKLANNAVGSGKVQDNSLQGIDVLDGSLQGTDVADGSLQSSDILDNTLGTADISTGGVTNSDLADGIVSTNKIAAEAVNSARVAQDTLTAFDIAAGAVGQSELGAGAVTPAAFGAIPAARAQKGGTLGEIQTVPNNTSTTLTFQSESFDTANLHDNATANSRLTAPFGGIYQVSAGVQWSGNSIGSRRLEIGASSTPTNVVARNTTPGLSGSSMYQNASGLVKLALGEFVVARVFQDSGEDAFTAGGQDVFLAMTWVGPG